MAASRLDQRSADEIGQEIAHLRDLDASALRLRWREVTGKPPATGLKGELLIRALAYVIPGEGLRRTVACRNEAPTGHRARRQGVEGKPGRRSATLGATAAADAGRTRLIREWQGIMHEVIVMPDGFLWRGEPYASLSTVAKAITGTSWNGWVFFGAKPPPKKAKRSATDQSPPAQASGDAGASVTLAGSNAHA